MREIRTRLTPHAWARVRNLSLLLIAVSVGMSIALTHLILMRFSAGMSIAGLMSATIMPLVLGGPMIFYLVLKHEQLHEANRQLHILATTDWLTDCLNRGAFSQAVDAHLAGGAPGALLVADADAFKQVNDRFGHHHGDTALKAIAAALRNTTPENALVGRLGGEEFGVFLPGADLAAAEDMADDLRMAVAGIHFAPLGDDWPLAISIGAAASTGRAAFDTLYGPADARLYAEKATLMHRQSSVA